MRNLLLSLLFFSGMSVIAQDWNVKELVSNPSYGSSAYGVEVADVRNNGSNSVFVSTSSGGVYEWVWNSSSKSWSYNTLITGFTGHVTIHAGEGRNDEKTRLYIVEWYTNGRILEASYSSGTWTIDTIAFNNDNTGVFVGDCRGSGINRLYVCTLAGVNEYTYNGTDWDKLVLDNVTNAAGPGYIGDAMNDGTNKYVSPGVEATMFSWNNSAFESSTFGPMQFPEMIYIGDGRNDNKNRVYVMDYETDKGRKEYTWNGTSWDVVTVATYSGRGAIYGGVVRADGKPTIFSSKTKDSGGTGAGELREHVWNGTAYSDNIVLDATSGATSLLDIGVGKNDDTVRVYAANFGEGSIYELTYKTPMLASSATGIEDIKIANSNDVSIFPVPANDYIVVDLNTDNSSQLALYNAMGVLVKEQTITNKSNVYVAGLEEGAYYITITSKNNIVTKKIVIKH